MIDRPAITRILLGLFAVGCVAVSVPLFVFGDAGDLANTTSGRILAAALLALAIGAVGAAVNPSAHRLVVAMLVGFSTLAALAIAYRVAFGHHPDDPARYILPLAVAAPLLLVVFFPRRPG